MKRPYLPYLLLLAAFMAVLSGCQTDPKVRAERYVANGNKYYDNGKYKEASIMYRRALQSDMKNGDAWYHLGLTNIKLANLGEAKRDFVRVTDVNPSNLDAYAKVGDIDLAAYLADPSRYAEWLKEAKTQGDAILKRNPQSYDGHRITGQYYAVQRQWKEALAEYQKADAIKPYQAEAGYGLAAALFNTQHTAEAEKYAKALIEKQKTFEQTYDLLYQYYLFSGKVSEAEQVLKQEVANIPNNGQVLVKLLQFYYLAKRTPDMNATLATLTSDPKKYPKGRLLAGDFFYSKAKMDDAVREYTAGANSDSKNKTLYQKRIAEALTVSGKADEANKVVAELLKETPKDPEVIAMNASLLLNRAKPADADKVIAQLQPLLAKTAPSEVDRATILHFNLGRAYALKGGAQNLDQAQNQFQEALKGRRVPYIPALMALAQLELQRGANPQAMDHASQVLRLFPGDLQAHLINARALMNLKELDKSRQELDPILKAAPNAPEPRFQMARLNFMEKRFPEAETDFEILRKANDPRGLEGIVECKIAENKPNDALKLLNDELARVPNSIPYREALASLEYTTGKYQNAEQDLRKLIAGNASAPEAQRTAWYMKLGETQRRLGDVNGAVAAFDKASQIDPKVAGPRLELALLLDDAGRSSESQKMYEEVLKIEPDNAVALNNLAYIEADQGSNLDQALTFAQRARQKMPQDLNILDTLGLIYLRKNLTDESVQMLKQLVAQKPEVASYHLHLGMALYQKGERAEAKREFEQALKAKPTGREKSEINEYISKIG